EIKQDTNFKCDKNHKTKCKNFNQCQEDDSTKCYKALMIMLGLSLLSSITILTLKVVTSSLIAKSLFLTLTTIKLEISYPPTSPPIASFGTNFFIDSNINMKMVDTNNIYKIFLDGFGVVAHMMFLPTLIITLPSNMIKCEIIMEETKVQLIIMTMKNYDINN
ncbi:hypothetical protein CR513_51124, partial [Mucuna pruriens]